MFKNSLLIGFVKKSINIKFAVNSDKYQDSPGRKLEHHARESVERLRLL
jgi:hypothetical protein